MGSLMGSLCCVRSRIMYILSYRTVHVPLGCCFSDFSLVSSNPGFTNCSRALQNNLRKICNARNHIFSKNFELKICTCAQCLALGTHTKFQLKILMRSAISAVQKFRQIFWRGCETLVKHSTELVIMKACIIKLLTYVCFWREAYI